MDTAIIASGCWFSFQQGGTMDTNTIDKICLWLDITEADLFQGAFQWTYGVEGDIEWHVEVYLATGDIPDFVRKFIKEEVYPMMVVH